MFPNTSSLLIHVAMLCALALVAAPSHATAADLTGGVRARFVDKPGTHRDRMVVVFKRDPAIAAPLPDPTRGASTLRVRWKNAAGVAELGPTPLVREAWRDEDRGGFFRYRDPAGRAAGLIDARFHTSLDGNEGALVLKAKGDGYGATPVGGPVEWVEVELTIDGNAYCGRFDPLVSRERRNDATKVAFSRRSGACTGGDPDPAPTIRVPAEWEEQEATWLQWPGAFEKAFEPAFAEMAKIIPQYQTLHILYASNLIRAEARSAILSAGGDPDHPAVVWHRVAYDNAWMRDNGPTYVVQDGTLRIQDWGFDAWGGGFGPGVPYAQDDAVPLAVGALTGLPVDPVRVVHERGNLEFNGHDAVILNWSVIGDPNRNPGYTREQAVADMKRFFGVTKVVLTEGFSPGDGTRGHLDGIARFISPDTVVVGQCTTGSQCQPGDAYAQIFDDAARVIEEAGFVVVREPFEGRVLYNGWWYDTDYLNWLVGNGFVITGGFGDQGLNDRARARLASYFPGRDVYIVDMLASWEEGGGVHCHTNDQPAASTLAGYTPWRGS